MHKPLHIDSIKYAEINHRVCSSRASFLGMYYLWSSSSLYWALQSPAQDIWRLQSQEQLSPFFDTSDNLICFKGSTISSAISVGTVQSICVICYKHSSYPWFQRSKIWGQHPIENEALAQDGGSQLVYRSVSQEQEVCNICQSQTSQNPYRLSNDLV